MVHSGGTLEAFYQLHAKRLKYIFGRHQDVACAARSAALSFPLIFPYLPRCCEGSSHLPINHLGVGTWYS